MGSAVLWLRILVVAQWVLAAGGALVDVWLWDCLPEPLRQFTGSRPCCSLSSLAVASLALLVAVALGVVGSLGILVRWAPARLLYAGSALLAIGVLPWLGQHISHAYAQPLYQLASLATGATLALLYLSPAARDFGAPPAEPAETLAASARGAVRGGLLLAVGALAGIGGLAVAAIVAGIAMFAATQSVYTEAARIGAETDDTGCLAKARERLAGGSWFESGFLVLCLESARQTEAFCSGVAAPPDEFDAPNPWLEERCKDEPDRDTCQTLLSTVQYHCSERGPSSTSK
jgi:hypothetical protein